jgi:hypothetical protein
VFTACENYPKTVNTLRPLKKVHGFYTGFKIRFSPFLVFFPDFGCALYLSVINTVSLGIYCGTFSYDGTGDSCHCH